MWISKHGIIIQGLTTFPWRRSLPYSNQSIGFQSKSMDWFLYDRYLRHERVKNVDATISVNFLIIPFILPLLDTRIITIFTFCLCLYLYFTLFFQSATLLHIVFIFVKYLLHIYYLRLANAELRCQILSFFNTINAVIQIRSKVTRVMQTPGVTRNPKFPECEISRQTF